MGVSISLDPKSPNCICAGSASVSNAHAMSQSGKPRLSVVGKREYESAMEKSSSSRGLLGILQGYDGARPKGLNGRGDCLLLYPYLLPPHGVYILVIFIAR